MQMGFILSLIFAILIAAFALKNGETVSIDLFFTTKEVSQAIVILASASFGAVIVMFLGLIRQIKLSLRVKDLNKKVKNLESERDELEGRINEFETSSQDILSFEDNRDNTITQDLEIESNVRVGDKSDEIIEIEHNEEIIEDIKEEVEEAEIEKTENNPS